MNTEQLQQYSLLSPQANYLDGPEPKPSDSVGFHAESIGMTLTVIVAITTCVSCLLQLSS